MIETMRPASAVDGTGRESRTHANLAPAALIEHALRQGRTRVAANGALIAETAPRTGRSPKDKFIVRDAETAEQVAWGGANQPIEPAVAGRLQARIAQYLREREALSSGSVRGPD
jgi:phosphoenolpyruvate carboxykinase (ATP)